MQMKLAVVGPDRNGGGARVSRDLPRCAASVRREDRTGVTDVDPSVYRVRVMLGALNAMVEAGAIGDTDHSIFDLPRALEGMCDAIAMAVAATGNGATAAERRNTAEQCRRLVLARSEELAERVAAGEELPWRLEAIGEVH